MVATIYKDLIENYLLKNHLWADIWSVQDHSKAAMPRHMWTSPWISLSSAEHFFSEFWYLDYQLEFLFLQSELTDLDFCNFRLYFWWFLTVVDRMVIFVLACRPPASAKRERILNWQLWYNIVTDIIEVSSSSSSYSFFIGPESDHWLCLSLTHSLTNWLTHSLTPV